MSRPIHFEIHAGEPQRVIAFYQRLFGWTFNRWEGPMEYWLVTTGPDGQPGINGGLMKRQGGRPDDGQAVNAFVCTVNVDSLDATLGALPGAGGSIAVPRMAVPGIGWLAYVKDPDGNILGVMQPDAAAR